MATDDVTQENLAASRANQARLDALDREINGLRGDGIYLRHPSWERAAAFELLEYLLTFRAMSAGKVMEDTGAVSFKIYADRRKPLVEWSIWRGKNGWNDSDTLTEAIALACRDALVALRKAGQGT